MRLLAALRRLWSGVPDWVAPRVDIASQWANVTKGEDE